METFCFVFGVKETKTLFPTILIFDFENFQFFLNDRVNNRFKLFEKQKLWFWNEQCLKPYINNI